MLKNRMHLVPQVVIDAANGLLESEREALKENFRERLEAIRDFCDSVLSAYKKDKKQQKISKNRR